MMNFTLLSALVVTILSVALAAAKIEMALREHERKQNRNRVFQARKAIYTQRN